MVVRQLFNISITKFNALVLILYLFFILLEVLLYINP